jgi:hypothetical protein
LTIVLNPQCPKDETLALFAAGDLDAQTRGGVLGHIEQCSECMAAVMSAHAYLQEEREIEEPRSTPRWWMGAVAAAALIAVVSIPLVRSHSSAPLAKLVDLAPKSERVVEARLDGGFAWAPYRGPVRSSDPAADVSRLKLGGAAAEVIEHAQSDSGAAAQHAAGVAMVLVGKPDEAAARLETIAKKSGDARTWSDLAAARYEVAMQFHRVALLPDALAAADQALRADGNLPEALFNRALILERMGRSAEARQAWERYLQVDSSSPWAAEARERR